MKINSTLKDNSCLNICKPSILFHDAFDESSSMLSRVKARSQDLTLSAQLSLHSAPNDSPVGQRQSERQICLLSA